MSRPSWEIYFLELAECVATRATCPRAHVGAVVVDEKRRVVITGYNGAPRGSPHCETYIPNCKPINNHCTIAVHAEQNAIAAAARRGSSLDGCTMYVSLGRLTSPNFIQSQSPAHMSLSDFPCHICRGVILASGIVSIVVWADGDIHTYSN